MSPMNPLLMESGPEPTLGDAQTVTANASLDGHGGLLVKVPAGKYDEDTPSLIVPEAKIPNGVIPELDPDVVPENIRDGVNIGGVEGTMVEEVHTNLTEDQTASAIEVAGGQLKFTAPAGMYPGNIKVKHAEPDLAAGSILTGKTIAGVQGSVVAEAHTPLSSDQTASAVAVAGGELKLTAPAGLYPGTVKVKSSEPDLAAGSILTGKTIAGVQGSVIAESHTALVSDQTAPSASVAGGNLQMTPPAGLYDGNVKVKHAEADLIADNILSGKTIAGVSGAIALTARNLRSGVTTGGVTGNFDGTFWITGHVLSGGAGLSGVTITGSAGLSGTATTDANGYFEFKSVASGATGVLTATKTGYTFTPATITISSAVTADVSGKDFSVAAPSAAFSSTPTQLSVAFTDASTGKVDSYDWDYGDGSSHGTTQNPTHVYGAAGTYTVRLTVTGPGGNNYVEHSVVLTVCAVTDALNGADGPMGADWDAAVGPASFAYASGKCAATSSSGSPGVKRRATAACGANHDVQVTVDNYGAGPHGRGTGASMNGYNVFAWDYNRYGIQNVVSQSLFAWDPADGDCQTGTYKLRCNGSTISGWKGGAYPLSGVDSNHTGLKVGLFKQNSNGANASNITNYSHDNVPACAMPEADLGPDGIVWVWVPLVRNGLFAGLLHPDLPDGMKWYHDDSVISDPVTGQLHTQLAYIGLAKADALKVVQAVPTDFDIALAQFIRWNRQNAYLYPAGAHPTDTEAHSLEHTWPKYSVKGFDLYFRPNPFTTILETEVADASTEADLRYLAGGRNQGIVRDFETIADYIPASDDRKRLLEIAAQYGVMAQNISAVESRFGL